jgi:membrane-bound metal-dependent hydrolase YbcI (DUF457 family)
MLFRTHISVAVLAFFAINHILEIPNKILFFTFLIAGTIFVDIDSKKSKIGNRWFLRPFQFLTKHRGILHTLIACTLISLIIASIKRWVGVAFFAGYLIHLLLDTTTKDGVKLFWPLNFKAKGLIRSGKTLEDTIFVLTLLTNIFLVGKTIFNYLI